MAQQVQTLEVRRSVSGCGFITYFWPTATDRPESQSFGEPEQLLDYLRKFTFRDTSPEAVVKQMEFNTKLHFVFVKN